MNKNLKILSEQAKTYAMNLSSSYGGYEPVSFMDHYTEKLVQLIISQLRMATFQHQIQINISLLLEVAVLQLQDQLIHGCNG